MLQVFGVKGPGEGMLSALACAFKDTLSPGTLLGLVWYPINLNKPDTTALARDTYATFVFKTKGEKHRVVNTKKPAQISAESVESAAKYAELMLAVPRLNQGMLLLWLTFVSGGGLTLFSGAQHVGGFDKKYIANFMKWIVADVEKEGKDELEASGLEWKQVAGVVTQKAREWYLAHIQEQAKGK